MEQRTVPHVGITDRGLDVSRHVGQVGLDVSRKLSYSSQSSSTSGCISDRGFESDFPAGGTIKKRPAANHISTDDGWNPLAVKTDFEQNFTSEEAMPPPPISRLSLESLDSLDMLPPPPPEICSPSPLISLNL